MFRFSKIVNFVFIVNLILYLCYTNNKVVDCNQQVTEDATNSNDQNQINNSEQQHTDEQMMADVENNKSRQIVADDDVDHVDTNLLNARGNIIEQLKELLNDIEDNKFEQLNEQNDEAEHKGGRRIEYNSDNVDNIHDDNIKMDTQTEEDINQEYIDSQQNQQIISNYLQRSFSKALTRFDESNILSTMSSSEYLLRPSAEYLLRQYRVLLLISKKTLINLIGMKRMVRWQEIEQLMSFLNLLRSFVVFTTQLHYVLLNCIEKVRNVQYYQTKTDYCFACTQKCYYKH